jgi:hypothetical protein
MNAVFIGGSRRLGRMNVEIARRLDNIMRKELCVLVGDANGFDREAQRYLADHGYRSVLIYCTNGECRNNVGGWPKHAIEFHGRGHGLEFYTAKDDAMLRDADYALFAWDGKSKGTLRNIRKMSEQAKPSAVYVSPTKKFVTVRSVDDAASLSRDMEVAVIGSEDLFCDTSQAKAVHLSVK